MEDSSGKSKVSWCQREECCFWNEGSCFVIRVVVVGVTANGRYSRSS